MICSIAHCRSINNLSNSFILYHGEPLAPKNNTGGKTLEERNVHQGSMPPVAMPIAQSNNTPMRAPAAPMFASIPDTFAAPPAMPRGTNMPPMPMMVEAASVPVMPEAEPAAAMEDAIETAAIITRRPTNTVRPEAMPSGPEADSCGHKMGELPPCAPLAAGFVPFQQKNPPKYDHAGALTRGTLFPGLDLPFMNTVNKSNPYNGTPLGEVMALDFACHELKLYLDTHKDDADAFEMLKTLLALSSEARKRYEKLFGPIDVRDLENADHFSWLNDPWPWEYAERTGI